MHYHIDFLERSPNIISATHREPGRGLPSHLVSLSLPISLPQRALWPTERNEGVSMANQVTLHDAPQLNEIQVIYCKIVVCHL